LFLAQEEGAGEPEELAKDGLGETSADANTLGESRNFHFPSCLVDWNLSVDAEPPPKK
jgi:hypothetical protein